MMRYLRFAFFLCAILLSCSKEEIGISSIDNPYADRQVSVYGGVVTVGFVADAAWTAELSLSDAGSWARISKVQGNEASGAGKVQVNFSTNKSGCGRVPKFRMILGKSSGASGYCPLPGGELSAARQNIAGDCRSPCNLRGNDGDSGGEWDLCRLHGADVYDCFGK